jgi:hypothetical protein
MALMLPERNTNMRHRDGIDLTGCSTIATERALKTDGRGTTVNSLIHIHTDVAVCDDGFLGDRIILALDTDVHHAIMTPITAVEIAAHLIWRAHRRGAPLGRVRDVLNQIDAAELPDAT